MDGRREINWDGGTATTAATMSGTTFTVFQGTRGALFTTPGTGFTQAPLLETTPADITLDEVVGTTGYAATFSTFSPRRIFTPLGSNVTDAQSLDPRRADTRGCDLVWRRLLRRGPLRPDND